MNYVETSREPLRPVVDTPSALDDCLASLRVGSGPVAFDTERAHGHRYWPKAYLLQIRREGSGTWLIDPIPFEGTDRGPRELIDACGDATWIIHSASQDLPCMAELGIIPPTIFDTELAARLLGKPSAGLGPLLLNELGLHLRKAHSADNWSRRPLPTSWLIYAALDVDYLLLLAELLREQLVASGRAEWAAQEDAETLRRYGTIAKPKEDPWRRLTGLSTLRTGRQLAVARALWEARDSVAQRRDRPPTWILPDRAIIEAATRSRDEVLSRSAAEQTGLGATPGRRFLSNWLAALDSVRAMEEQNFPPRKQKSQGVPLPRSWDRINPAAADRWAAARPVIDELACDLGLSQPSLIGPPKVLQEALFSDEPATEERLLSLGARPWQVAFLAPAIAYALTGDPDGPLD